ncbi:MAG: hypothetical protein OEX02_09760 [Cyclobacteriaceae bacterium]|nr:hypothetical protein [Cyclobacteriaceae bacterium]
MTFYDLRNKKQEPKPDVSDQEPGWVGDGDGDLQPFSTGGFALPLIRWRVYGKSQKSFKINIIKLFWLRFLHLFDGASKK